jgi:hypothetical protein
MVSFLVLVRFDSLITHDLFGKPVTTFPDHACPIKSGTAPTEPLADKFAATS